MRKTLVAVLVLAVLLCAGAAMMAAAGGQKEAAAPAAVGDFGQPEAQKRFDAVARELYPKAKVEGALIIYTMADVEDIERLTEGFQDQYPDIKVDCWNSEAAQIVTRTMEEFRAGQASVDVLQHDVDAYMLRDQGALEPFQSVQQDDLVVTDPTIAVIGMEVQGVAYNTKKLTEADLPKSWEDMASPRFKGIMALNDPLSNGPLTVQLAILKGTWKDDAKWLAFVKGLKALDVPVHRSTGAMFRLMVAGEYSITEPALMHDVITEMEKGSPVDYVRSFTPVCFPDFMVLYAKAPHPNAAKLFIEWVLSPAGQMAYAATGRTPNLRGLEVSSSIDKLYGPGTKPVTTVDPEFIENQREWIDTYLTPIFEGK